MPRPTCRPSLRLLLPLILSLWGGTAAAQTASESITLLPTQLQYTSPLRAYQAYADEPIQSWREANDRVGRIGGWRAYAKEASTNDPVKAEPPANPHTGQHGGHKP
ncbi:MAG: hypothetical protein QMB14_08670 [Polaromonas sp.]|jgi:hypothetical protein